MAVVVRCIPSAVSVMFFKMGSLGDEVRNEEWTFLPHINWKR